MNPQDLMTNTSLGVCIKDPQRNVLFQNNLCIEKCGNKMGGPCLGPCVQKYDEFCVEKNAKVEGFCHFKKINLENGIADAVVMNDNSQFLTLLYPLENKNKNRMDYYQEKNLTKCELKIASLMLNGLSNAEIIKELFISKATLKTHINNIYKKIPPEMAPRL
jgi:DNA-binding CsgD family transcriptional regulator